MFWNFEFGNFTFFCILTLVGRWASPNILTWGVLTAREVFSLWGRVEKMLFRPIRKKKNSLSFNNGIYLTLYTFSFEINESRLVDTRCLIQDVVSPHCGDKRMARRCTRRSLPNYFDMTSYHWNVRQNTVI